MRYMAYFVIKSTQNTEIYLKYHENDKDYEMMMQFKGRVVKYRGLKKRIEN